MLVKLSKNERGNDRDHRTTHKCEYCGRLTGVTHMCSLKGITYHAKEV